MRRLGLHGNRGDHDSALAALSHAFYTEAGSRERPVELFGHGVADADVLLHPEVRPS